MEEMRAQSASTAKEMAAATKDCRKDVMKGVNGELAASVSTLRVARTPRKRGIPDDEEEKSEELAPARARGPATKRRRALGAGGGAVAAASTAGGGARRP